MVEKYLLLWISLRILFFNMEIDCNNSLLVEDLYLPTKTETYC